MKIALVNPVKFLVMQPPLGLAYIASYLRKYDQDKHEIKIIDENVGQIAEKEIEKFKPDIIGITATTPQITRASEICKFIRNTYHKTKTIVGGVHPTVLPEQTLQESDFDIVVIREGEITFFELVQLLKKTGNFEEKDLKEIKGIAFRNGNEIIKTEERPLIENLDIIPFPARDLLDEKYYFRPQDVLRGIYKVSTQVMSSRGCPYNCAFCSSFIINKQKFRMHSAEYVIKEIEQLIKDYKIEAVFFQDDNFVVNRKRVTKICNYLTKNNLNNKLVWSVQMRADWLKDTKEDVEFLKLLKEAGCIQVEFGFESGSQKILSFLKKNTVTIEQNEQAIKMCKQAGLRVFGNFMIGSQGETKEDMEMTKSFIKNHKNELDNFGVFITAPYPGTELWNICKKEGLLEGLTWDDLKMDKLYPSYESKLFSNTLSRKQIIDAHKELVSMMIEKQPLNLKLSKILGNPKKMLQFSIPYLKHKIRKLFFD